MSESRTHETNVTTQFGPRAAAYVSSAVHAGGADLAQIADLAKAHRPARALDMGCGGGHVSFQIAPHAGEVTAYDLSDDMLKAVAREAGSRGLKNIVTRQGSVEKTPFENSSFDFVASRYSAHHWHDIGAGIMEARRVVKSDGIAIFADTVTSDEPLLDTHLQAIELLRDPSHVRDYAVSEWTRLLKDAGFMPGEPVLRRVRLDFASWVARMATPEASVQVIRALQAGMPRNVAEYFALEPDGSFTINSMTIEAKPL